MACFALAQSVVQELEVEQHKHVLHCPRQASDELPRDLGRGKLEHMLNRRLDLREVLVHNATQDFRILPERLGDQRGVKEQMDAALSAVQQPLRLHARLPRPAPSWRVLFGHSLLIGQQGYQIELGPLRKSCR